LVFREEFTKLNTGQQPQRISNNLIKPTASALKKPDTSDTRKITINAEDAVMGSSSAKVTFIEFADFQCPYCRHFWSDTLPLLKRDYINTGKVRFVYKLYAILGQESIDSANAVLCAKEQNKFWEYHDYLYDQQKGENEGDFSIDNLNKFAQALNLQTDQFRECLNKQKYIHQVISDVTEGHNQDISGTPTSIINDIVVNGTQPYEAYKTIIDEQLTK